MEKKKRVGIADALKTDTVTAGIAVATVVGIGIVPVFGWAVGLAGGGVIAYRAVKRGLKQR